MTSQLSKRSREAHPIIAAEQRQNVAPGLSPGFSVVRSISTGGATDSVDSFAPMGLCLNTTRLPGLSPGATFCRRFAAQQGHGFRGYIPFSTHVTTTEVWISAR